MDIKVNKVTPMTKGNLRAFVEVQVGEIIIRDCRVVQQPGQNPWVSMPARSYEKDGKTQWISLVEMPRELKAKVEQVVLEALRDVR